MSLDYTVEEQRKDTEMSDVVGLDEGDGGDKQKVMIKLIAAKDGTSFVLPLEYASISLLVQTVVKCDDEHCSEIPFENVNGPTLAYMVEYMNHHAGKPTAPPLKPLRSNNLADQCTDKWDAELVDRVYSQDQGLQFLYDLIVACNYADLHGLLHLACAKVATLIKGQPLHNIKQILDPQNPSVSTQNSAADHEVLQSS